MPELKRRDFVTWSDVDIGLDHMRVTYGLVGTVELYRADDGKGKAITKVGVLWRAEDDQHRRIALLSAAITWPHVQWKSVPGLLLFIMHRDEDLWLKKAKQVIPKVENDPF